MRIKEIRQSKGISIVKLSTMCGLSRRTLEDIEKRSDCMVSNAIKIAEALGVTLEELCRDNIE